MKTKLRKLKYPRIPKELDLRRKLSDDDITMIKVLRKEGISIAFLTRYFHVSRTVISYHTNEKARLYRIYKSVERNRLHPEITNKNAAERLRRLRSINPDKHRKYLTDLQFNRNHKL